MGKVKSAISGIGGIASNTRASVTGFENAPLANAGYLLTVGALCMAVPTFIVALALAFNNIGAANQSALSSANANFLSAGTLYLQNAATMIFLGMLVVALVLFLAYKMKSPVSKGGESISYQMRIWVMGVLFSLVVAPLVLLFAENILTIIVILVLCLILFFMFSSGGAKTERVDEDAEVFRATTARHGNGIFGYSRQKDEAFYICSQEDYDKGKVNIVGLQSGRNRRPERTVPSRRAERALEELER